MKKRFLIIFALLLLQNSIVISQNLVPNPSFENITQCPNTFGQIYFATPWFQPLIWLGNTTSSSTSELYNSCDVSLQNGVPLNALGFQAAKSGLGYCGIIVYNDSISNYREYIEVPLISPLISNNIYCVEFYVSIADTYEATISNFGAYLSVDSLLDSTQANAINYVTPQVENSAGNMLNDTTNWMLVSGNFVATGGEKFLTIGNFRTPINTNVQHYPWRTNLGGYYYIDDVSVIDCGVGVKERSDGVKIKLYPNPATNSLSLTLTNGAGILAIYNVLGECMLSTKVNGMETTIDVSEWARGMYFVEVRTENGVIRKKVMKE